MRTTGRRDLKSHSFKKRKSIFSFGDIILPFVGVLAVGMLIFAAKLFFFDNFPASSALNEGNNAVSPSVQSVPRIKLKAEDNPLFPAAGEASAEEADGSTEFFEAEFKNELEELESENKNYKNEDENSIKNKNSDVTAVNKAPSANITVTVTPVNVNNDNKNSRQAAQVKKNNNAPVKKNNNAQPANQAQKAQTQQNNNNAQWRVQVGAYGSKKAADEIIAKLTKAGYKTTYYAVSKYHKVWVQAGNTKQAAEAVAGKLKKTGYPGSFVIPPPVRK